DHSRRLQTPRQHGFRYKQQQRRHQQQAPYALARFDLFSAQSLFRRRLRSGLRVGAGYRGRERFDVESRQIRFFAVEVDRGAIGIAGVSQAVEARLARRDDQFAGAGLFAVGDPFAVRRVYSRRVSVFRWRGGERLADEAPRALLAFAQMSCHLANERQIDRRQGQIVPVRVERRSEEQQLAAAARGLDQGRAAVFEARDHAGPFAGSRADIAEDAGGRQSPAAFEDLEDRVIGLDLAHHHVIAAPAAREPNRFFQLRGREVLKDLIERGGFGVRAGCDDQAAAALDKFNQRLSQRLIDLRVVEDDYAIGLEVGGVDRACRFDL